MGVGVGKEGEASQAEDVCTVFATSSSAAQVALLDVSQNLQNRTEPSEHVHKSNSIETNSVQIWNSSGFTVTMVTGSL